MAMVITITGTMNTIPTKVAFPFWGGAGVGLVVLGLGAPKLAGRLMLLPADDTRLALLEGRSVPTQTLQSFEATRLRTASWFPVNAVANDLAMSTFERALQAPAAQRPILLKDAEYWQRRALSITPADAYGWLRLSYLYLAMDGASPRSAAAFAQSYASAPYEPRLLAARVQTGLKLGSFLDPDMQRRLPAMIRDAMRADKDELVFAAKQDNFIGVVEQALADYPDDLARFRSALKDLE